ncbi:MAG: hypothetical protein ACR2LF_01140 [Jatrophihabitantaceae bacterium]
MTSPAPLVPACVRRGATFALSVAAATALAGCGSSAAPHHSSSPSPTPSSSPSSSPASTGSGSGTQTADAATVAAVKSAYAKFFDSKTPENISIGLLQDGPAFKSTLDAQGKGSLAQNAAASVSSVTLQSPNTAAVIFTISLSGKPVLKDQPGYAVRENGTWKLAGKTFCGLLTLQGSPPPACMTASATALPH